MPFEPFDETTRLRGRESLVEGGGIVSIQVVLDEDDLFRVRETLV